MSIESKLSGHWTDEQLIAHLYGAGPEDDHMRTCADCQARLASMQVNRQIVESAASASEDIDFDFLAAQRRKIYSKIDQPLHWWSAGHLRRWASAAAALFVLGGGIFIFEQEHQVTLSQQTQQQTSNSKISDAQLAIDVSQMAGESEPPPTAPLQELFAE